jgi:hypothetical protein
MPENLFRPLIKVRPAARTARPDCLLEQPAELAPRASPRRNAFSALRGSHPA